MTAQLSQKNKNLKFFPKVTHVEGDVDPIRDLDIISTELRLKDIQILESQIPKLENISQKVDKQKAKDLTVMKECLEWLKQGKDIRSGDWKSADVKKTHL